YRFQFSTAARRLIAVNPTFEVGTFYNGTRRRIATDLNIRLRPGLIIYTSAEWNQVKLVQGSFNTRLYRIVPELQFSPWGGWVNNLPHDPKCPFRGGKSSSRWTPKPANYLSSVYTQNWLDDPLQPRLFTLDRRFATKLLYTRRF